MGLEILTAQQYEQPILLPDDDPGWWDNFWKEYRRLGRKWEEDHFPAFVTKGLDLYEKYPVGPCGIAGPSTLEPRPFAGESIPARGPGRDFTPQERAEMNRIGDESGCHTCGARDPGTKSGNWICDHQPVSCLNPEGGAQALYPQCLGCSRRQGGDARQALK